MLRKLLLSPDLAEGGENPTGEKPPAAALVSTAKANEDEAGEIVRRRRELEEREKKVKDRETAIAEKEDRARQEREAAESLKQKPANQKREWLNGLF